MEDRERNTVPPGNERPDAARERQLELLELSRKRLLAEIQSSTHPRMKALKQRALDHVEAQIAALRR